MPDKTIQTIWLLIDRRYTVRQVRMNFDQEIYVNEPLPQGKKIHLRNILDGELVWDNKNVNS